MIYSSNVSHKTSVMVYSLKFYEKNKVDDILLECLTQKQGVWYTPLMSQTKIRVMVYSSNFSEKTRGMMYSSNVSHKNKVDDILLECLTQKQVVWYTPRMSQTKTRGMIYSLNVSEKNKGYGTLLECLRQKQGAWYTPRMSQTKRRVMEYSSNVSHKKVLLYIPRMSQTQTSGMMYSSNVSHKNKCYDILLEFLRKIQGWWYIPRMSQTKTMVMVFSSNVSDTNKGHDVLLKCLTHKQGYDILVEVLSKTQGLWYTPRNDYTNIWVMVCISKFKTKIVLCAPRR